LEYKVVGQSVLFDNPMAKIVIDTLEYGGMRRKYFYLASPVEAVATVGLTDSGQLTLTRQYRHPVGRVIYDLPAGRLNPGEDPLDGARREFEEETGYFPRHIERLGYYNQFPGMLQAGTTLFFARDLTPTRQNLDDGEVLEVVELPVEDVLAMIGSGELIDGSLQLGILLAWSKGLLTR
jgi:ADP-ribose pyrophosphatase